MKQYLTWKNLGMFLSGLVTLMMIYSGGSKIVGTEEMVNNFNYMNLSPYRVMVGILEVLGGVALLIPRTSQYGAVLVASIMTAAVAMHLSLGFPGTMMPIVLGSAALIGYKLNDE